MLLYFLLLEIKEEIPRECTCVADSGGFPLISPLVSWTPPILYPLPPRYLPDGGVESLPEVPSSRSDSPFSRFSLDRVDFTDYALARVQPFDISSRCINALRPSPSSLHVKHAVPRREWKDRLTADCLASPCPRAFLRRIDPLVIHRTHKVPPCFFLLRGIVAAKPKPI